MKSRFRGTFTYICTATVALAISFVVTSSYSFLQHSKQKDAPEDMALIPAGEFVMGSDKLGRFDDERPAHRVYVDAFWIDKYEVTNAQFREMLVEMNETIYPEDPIPGYFEDYPDYPVLVTYKDAFAYAWWAGKRLPTEAEWEKAARGGLVNSRYPWGNEEPENRTNYYFAELDKELSSRMVEFYKGRGPLPVGSFPPNGYGIYDMAGNFMEWVSDYYERYYYSKSPEENPKGPKDGKYKVLRGGAWNTDGDYLEVTNRYWGIWERWYVASSFGFRCVKDVE